MPTTTTNMGLEQPLYPDPADIQFLNGNWTILDGHDHSVNSKGLAVKRVQNDLFASRPAAGTGGALFVATDTDRMFFDNGSAWNELAVLADVTHFTTQVQVDGTVGLGAAPVAYAELVVQPNGTLSGATTQYFIVANGIFGSGATASGAAVTGSVSTAAAAFTMASAIALSAGSPALGAGSAITTAYGLFVNNQGGAGVGTAYGVFISTPSGATTNIALASNGDSLIGTPNIANGATSGFLYLASGGGSPTGNPAFDGNGWKAMRFDTSTNKLWIYNGGWKSVTLT